MIVALAGHVDHGKTSLIRALTGVETDRLQQEVARGLTIDLGFAYCHDGAAQLGFVDVPGHHRFIHNMLAGVSTHQAALLVIAADDGVMPQTREHLAIMQLLGLRQGVVAINKIDRVDPQRLSQVKAQIRSALADSFLRDAPMIEVSATTNVGIEALREGLMRMAGMRIASPDIPDAPARMPIDRAFSYKGVGTIVTGTLHAGRISVLQELNLFPSNQRARVRSLRVNDRPAEHAQVGDRVAVNLAGIEVAELRRGMWLQAGSSRGYGSVVIELSLLAELPRGVRHWSPVHLYHGASHTLAHVALLQHASAIVPGQTALVELICAEPLLAVRGDRVIVRDHGLDLTLGGGPVVSNQPATGRRRAASRVAWLQEQLQQQRAGKGIEDAFVMELAQGWVNLQRFQQEWDISTTRLNALVTGARLLVVEQIAITDAALTALQDATLAKFTAQIGSQQGLTAPEFCSAPSPAITELILKRLIAAQKIQLQAGRYVAPAAAHQLTASELQLMQRLLPELSTAQPPSLGDVGKKLSIPTEQLRKAALPLVGKGRLLLFGNNRLMLPEQFSALAALAADLEQREGPFSVKQFRDASGLGRNLVIDVLEHMDSGGYTKRFGDNRKVVGDLRKLLRQ